MSSAVLRYYDDYKELKEKIFTNIFIDYIFLTIVVILTFIAISFISINIKLKDYLLFTILLFIGCSLSDLFASIVRASKETKIYVILVITQYIISIFMFLILTIVYNMKISAVFISYIISYLIIILYYIIHYRIYKYIKLKDYSFEIQKKFLKYGLPMVGVWATSWILNYSDRYIIQLFTSTEKVGLYDIAYKLSENSINIITTSISMAMMPHIIEEFKNGGNIRANDILKKYLKIFNIIIIPAIFGLIGIRNHIYGTLISIDYISGSNIIIYISISMFFLGTSQLLYKIWQLNEKTVNILRLMIFSVILNILLNIIFVPKYGFIVAAVTTLLSNIITFVLTYYSIKRAYLFKFDYLSFIKILSSSILMYLFIIIVNPFINSIPKLILEIVIAIIIYFVSLMLFKEIKDEMNTIKSHFRKNKVS